MRSADEARGWADDGLGLLLEAVDGLTDRELDERCALPGWSRRHLLGQVASNAEAMGRLLDRAQTAAALDGGHTVGRRRLLQSTKPGPDQ